MTDSPPRRKTPILRASEIARYIYCNRAWWYDRQGVQSSNTREMERGAAYHRQHGRTVSASGVLQAAAALLFAAAVLAVILYLFGLAV